MFLEPIQLDLPDCDILYVEQFFSIEESHQLFTRLNNDIVWQQDNITLFGKTHLQPRLTALMAENENAYTYSNITMYPREFAASVKIIKDKVEAFTHQKFTTCLANLYRNGQDSNGWHADNEKELAKQPIIASVSFGASRFFHLKHKKDKVLKQKIELKSGSLLLMQGETQDNYLHQIAKTKKEVGPRINLTFRIIN
jgi:alkylated DNA repair dioxygenase AlkB